jgi:hypothetical protein
MKIFWSWQSDRPGKISRHLVREALELAVDELNKDLAIEEPEREVSLDHDRKGVPGSPDLASVILEKIRGCDVFIADVTPVGETANKPPKKLMNPNVAIELGYALHTITDRRMIMVMNSHFGTNADLPFDLRHKAGPILYYLPTNATKGQIKEVKKQLAGELKAALREIVPVLRPPAVPFQEVAARISDPSRYYEPSQVLFMRRGGYREEAQPFRVAETPTVYLRVVPTKQTAQLKRADAYRLIRQGPNHLNPFYCHRSGSSFEQNEFGAIAFDADYEHGEIVSAAQLFLNHEIWAFNTVCLSPERRSHRSDGIGVPTLDVELTFAMFLPEYARFLNDDLGVSPPYRIEGGAFGTKGYVLFVPREEWGPIHDNHIRWSGTLANLDATVVDAVLLNIFEAFFDAGGRKRPDKLYGFPGDQPGTLPRYYSLVSNLGDK